MELKLNTHVQYICTHITVRFLQKHSVFMPEGEVFEYEQTTAGSIETMCSIHCHVYATLHTSYNTIKDHCYINS